MTVVVWGLSCCLLNVDAATKIEGGVNMTYFIVFLVTFLLLFSCKHHIVLVRKNHDCSMWLDDCWQSGKLSENAGEKQKHFSIATWRKVVRT